MMDLWVLCLLQTVTGFYLHTEAKWFEEIKQKSSFKFPKITKKMKNTNVHSPVTIWCIHQQIDFCKLANDQHVIPLNKNIRFCLLHSNDGWFNGLQKDFHTTCYFSFTEALRAFYEHRKTFVFSTFT